jgi:hypothetical protein
MLLFFEAPLFYIRPGLGKVRPAKHLNVAREYSRELYYYRKHVKNPEIFYFTIEPSKYISLMLLVIILT